MVLMEERIRRDGVVKEGGILKVDSFLNQQTVSYTHLRAHET